MVNISKDKKILDFSVRFTVTEISKFPAQCQMGVNISVQSVLSTNRINLSLQSPPHLKNKQTKTTAIVVVYFPETKNEEYGSVWANYVNSYLPLYA